MSHWDAYYQKSVLDLEYPTLNTTISAGASHFSPGDFGDQLGHAVANALGAFTASQPRYPLMQPEVQLEEDAESGFELVSHTVNILYMFNGWLLRRSAVCVCVCVCVCGMCVCVRVYTE